ncbi:MAG: hypothetical protein M3Z16_01365 [Pseudomonadota bacterium]|nr:hypothetical protein [Pseudomonadota bacterium]
MAFGSGAADIQSMKIGRARLLASLVMSVAIAAATLWLMLREPADGGARRRGAETRQAALASAAHGASPDVAAATPAGQPLMPATTAAAEPVASARLHQQLSVAKDWRRFALDAMTRPSEGGYLYARYVVRQCEQTLHQGALARELSQAAARDVVASSSTVSAQQLAKMSDIASACEAFAPGEAASLLEALRGKEATGADPLLQAVKAVDSALASSNRDAIRSAAQVLLQTRDPLALSEGSALARVLASDAEASQASGMYFDGVVYSATGNDTRALEKLSLAVQLALCDAGQICEMGNLMRMSCVVEGACTNDPRAWAREEAARSGLSEADFSAVTSLEARIRQALAGSETRAFVR